MPPTARAKRRLTYKRLLDKRDRLRREELRLHEQQSKLDAVAETHKTELDTVTAQHGQDISHLEAIKTFFEGRYGQYDELVRAQQENVEDVNQVQGMHESLVPVEPESAAAPASFDSEAATAPAPVERESIDQDDGETGEPHTTEQISDGHRDENDDMQGMNSDIGDVNIEEDQQEVDDFSDDESEDWNGEPFANMARRRRPL